MNRYAARELVTFDKSLSKGARLVYTMLDEYGRDKGDAFPSQETLVERSGIKLRSLQRYIGELARAGLVAPYRQKPGGPNHYRLYHAPPVAAPPAKVGGTLPPPVAGLIRKNTGIEYEDGSRPVENPQTQPPAEWDMPVSPPNPDVCTYCRGLRFVGVGSNRSECGICRGSGRLKIVQKRA